MHRNNQYDVCIVGSGVAGSALAATLGQQGLKVALVEKHLFKLNRIVGELLQPKGVELMHEMNLQEALEEIDAQTIHGYALIEKDADFAIPYSSKNNKETYGLGFHNGEFVMKLRSVANKNESVHIIEGQVESLIYDDNETVTGVNYNSKEHNSEQQIFATVTVISEGCFSKLREGLNLSKPVVKGHFIGLILEDTTLQYSNHGHVILTDRSTMLCYPISSTETRLLIDFPGVVPPKGKTEILSYLNNHIANFIPDEMQVSYLKAVYKSQFKVMPNQILNAHITQKNGVAILGDAMNMRHPLTGGGMTVALSDVKRLSKVILDNINNEQELSNAISSFYIERTEDVSTINILANALYDVLSDQALKKACFSYLKKGNSFAEEPISILSGLSHDKKLLLNHFFKVALYGAKDISTPVPTYNKVKESWQMINHAYGIIKPLLEEEEIPEKKSPAYRQIAKAMIR